MQPTHSEDESSSPSVEEVPEKSVIDQDFGIYRRPNEFLLCLQDSSEYLPARKSYRKVRQRFICVHLYDQKTDLRGIERLSGVISILIIVGLGREGTAIKAITILVNFIPSPERYLRRVSQIQSVSNKP